MRAGLLADLLLGGNSDLKNLINQFNFMILNPNGKITGFNHHMLRNSGKTERELIHQNFFILFEPDEGNADFAIRIKSALQGNTEAISFRLPGQNLLFHGAILPVFDGSDKAEHLLILCREEEIEVSEEEALNYFGHLPVNFLKKAESVPTFTNLKPI